MPIPASYDAKGNLKLTAPAKKSEDKKERFMMYWLRHHRNGAAKQIMPVTEHQFAKAWKRKFQFDWAFLRYKIAVEVDGGQFAYRGGRHSGDKDREKMNIAAALGWRVFHFSPQMLDSDPVACVRIVEDTLFEIHQTDPKRYGGPTV